MLFNFPSREHIEKYQKPSITPKPKIRNKAINAHASCDHTKKVVFQYFLNEKTVSSIHVLSTAMYRRIEHIESELLICRSPASICNYIFSAVFTYFWGGGGGFLRIKRWLLGWSPRPRWGSLQRSPTPPSWAGGVPPSRTLPGGGPAYFFATPLTTPSPVPPPLPIPGSATACSSII